MTKKRKFLLFICIFLIVFNCFNYRINIPSFKEDNRSCSYNIYYPKADVASAVIGGMTLGGGIDVSAVTGVVTSATGAITLAAPYVCAFCVFCIACGVVFHNRAEIQSALVDFYNYCVEKGKDISSMFTRAPSGDVVITHDGASSIVDNIVDTVNEVPANNVIASTGDISVPYTASLLSKQPS